MRHNLRPSGGIDLGWHHCGPRRDPIELTTIPGRHAIGSGKIFFHGYFENSKHHQDRDRHSPHPGENRRPTGPDHR